MVPIQSSDKRSLFAHSAKELFNSSSTALSSLKGEPEAKGAGRLEPAQKTESSHVRRWNERRRSAQNGRRRNRPGWKEGRTFQGAKAPAQAGTVARDDELPQGEKKSGF